MQLGSGVHTGAIHAPATPAPAMAAAALSGQTSPSSTLGGPSLLSNQDWKSAPSGQQVLLTEEEKRTLVAEGYPIPQRFPLSKAEERSLKKIRRKIKNKISAQESRRKKKEYMEELEKKVQLMEARIAELERENSNLFREAHNQQQQQSSHPAPIIASPACDSQPAQPAPESRVKLEPLDQSHAAQLADHQFRSSVELLTRLNQQQPEPAVLIGGAERKISEAPDCSEQLAAQQQQQQQISTTADDYFIDDILMSQEREEQQRQQHRPDGAGGRLLAHGVDDDLVANLVCDADDAPLSPGASLDLGQQRQQQQNQDLQTPEPQPSSSSSSTTTTATTLIAASSSECGIVDKKTQQHSSCNLASANHINGHDFSVSDSVKLVTSK